MIDVLNEDIECDVLYNGHNDKLYGATGGKIGNDFVHCGGSIGFGSVYKDRCYILGDNTGPIIEFNYSDVYVRYLTMYDKRHTLNGGVILPNNTIFITGKYTNA